jgi:hypothetical protein
MKIGVTGAFGFLGANFIASLLDDRRQTHSIGDDVGITAFASRTRSNPLFDPSAVRVEGLDVLDYEDMARKFAGLDAIAHFAGRVDYSIRAKRSVWVANVLGTKRVLDAAMSAGVGRVLHVSSICVLGTRSRGGDRPARRIRLALREESIAHLLRFRDRGPGCGRSVVTRRLLLPAQGEDRLFRLQASRMGAGEGLRERARAGYRHGLPRHRRRTRRPSLRDLAPYRRSLGREPRLRPRGRDFLRRLARLRSRRRIGHDEGEGGRGLRRFRARRGQPDLRRVHVPRRPCRARQRRGGLARGRPVPYRGPSPFRPPPSSSGSLRGLACRAPWCFPALSATYAAPPRPESSSATSRVPVLNRPSSNAGASARHRGTR